MSMAPDADTANDLAIKAEIDRATAEARANRTVFGGPFTEAQLHRLFLHEAAVEARRKREARMKPRTPFLEWW